MLLTSALLPMRGLAASEAPSDGHPATVRTDTAASPQDRATSGETGTTQPRTAPEYVVKAAFLLNFVRFVRWPERAFDGPADPYRVAVLGDDPFGAHLDRVLIGKKVRGRPFRVRRISEPGEIEAPHLLFISRSAEDELTAVLKSLADRPVMSVGDREGLARRGLVAGFYLEGGRVRFAINHRRARAVGLEISSRLLGLARVVESTRDSSGGPR